MANADKVVKSESLMITCEVPIPNIYNTLPESKLIKTETPDLCGVKDLQHEIGVVIKTEPTDNVMPCNKLTTPEKAENRTLQYSTEQSCLTNKDQPNDYIENHRNVIHQVNQTLHFVPPGTAAKRNPLTCDVCYKRFSKPSYLTSHKRTHTGEKPFACHFCGKQFTQSYNLTAHGRSHTVENPFVCEICGKQFKYSSALTVHKRTHSGEKPFDCDLCDKSFLTSSSLTRHRRVHTGEKPFVCDLCAKSFTRPSTLTQHKRSHTGEQQLTTFV